MLWTDTLYPTPADINSIAPDLAGDIAGEGQSTGLLGLCNEAYSHCSGLISSKIQSVIGATNFNPSGGATSLHNAAIIWGVRAQSQVVRLRMGQIVMNDLYQGDILPGSALWGPLRTWLTYWAITLGYRHLTGRVTQSTDRYQQNYNNYRRYVGGEKWNILASTGLPYVRVPLPAPGAIFEQGSGRWTAANLSQVVPGSGSPAGGNFYVAITWVAQGSSNGSGLYVSPLKTGNAESGPSQIAPTLNTTLLSTTISSGNVLSIDITSLNPPTGTVNPAQASITGVSQGTMIATGWNIYVGVGDGGNPPAYLYLQNSTPIPIATKTHALTGDPVLSGYTMGAGQYPDANMGIPNTMMRQ